jgi:hypothetical protein
MTSMSPMPAENRRKENGTLLIIGGKKVISQRVTQRLTPRIVTNPQDRKLRYPMAEDITNSFCPAYGYTPPRIESCSVGRWGHLFR